MKKRNPVAKAVTRIRPKVVANKRREKMNEERLREAAGQERVKATKGSGVK